MKAWPPVAALVAAWVMVIGLPYGLVFLDEPAPRSDESDGEYAGLATLASIVLSWAAWLPLALTLLVAAFVRSPRSALGKPGTAWLALLVLLQAAIAAIALRELAEGWEYTSPPLAGVAVSALAAAALTAWLAWRGQPAPAHARPAAPEGP